MNILVRGTNWIGDSVMSVPALRQLRKAFPDAKITLAAPSWSEGIFRDADFLDEILVIEDAGHSPRSVLSRAGIFRWKAFDAAILFTNSFGTALVARAAGIPKRFGYGSESRGFLLTKALPKPVWKSERHEAFYYLNLVEGAALELGAEMAESEPDFGIPVSAERRKAARSLLEEHGIGSGDSFVVIGAGSTNSRAKRWPAERFAAVADALSREEGLRAVLLGSKEEDEVARNVIAAAEGEIVDLCGGTTLDEAVSVIAEASLMVSNDMGLAHVSAAVGTPTVTIFGPTNHLTTAPWGAEIVREQVECSPCMLRDCPIDHRCMTRIRPETVVGKARAALAR